MSWNRLTIEEVKENVENISDCTLLSTEYKNAREKLTFKCSCGEIFLMDYDNFKRKKNKKCKKCTSKRLSKKFTWTHEHFLLEVSKLVGNEYEVIGLYGGSHAKLSMKHNCGFEYDVTPANFLNGKRCPKCSGYLGWLKKDTEYFKNEVKALTDNEYVVQGEYKSNQEKIEILHSTCGNIFKSRPNDFLNGRRCPRCRESKGEKKISRILKKNNINFIPQYTFDDLIGATGRKLKFDFAIIENNNVKLLIEYDGEFHFEDKKDLRSEKSFKRQKLYDSLKNEYCIKNNIKLIRIPYWKRDSIEEILKDAI